MSGTDELYGDPQLAAAYARRSTANVANAAYERPAVRALLGDVRNLDVLDGGCASGEHSAWLADCGARVVALDASEAMVALARAQLGPTATVLHADLADPLPFEDRSFDVVLCSLSLHYLADWNSTLREFARILRRGGRLVISTHHPLMTLPMVRDYHAVSTVDDAWSGLAAEPVAVRYYHRPLQRIIGDVLAAGFLLRGLHEPQPTAEADARDAAFTAQLRLRPGFLIVDAERRLQ